MELPIKKIKTRIIKSQSQDIEVSYKILDERKVCGYFNRRIGSDVYSHAVLDVPTDRTAIVVKVYIPLEQTWDPAKAMADGVPDGICINGPIETARLRYGKWRLPDGELIGTQIDNYCGYTYDLSF